ncbi:MAG: hypothetical protein ABL860_07170 [Candidatus Nitrotoga sp.]
MYQPLLSNKLPGAVLLSSRHVFILGMVAIADRQTLSIDYNTSSGVFW